MKLFKAAVVVALILFVASSASAAETKRIAVVKDLQGVVEVNTGSAWSTAKVGMILNEGDSIRTSANSKATLNLDKDAETGIVEVKENTKLKLAELIGDQQKATQSTLLDLAMGEVLIRARKLDSENSRFEVKTPTSIVGVRGTVFSVAVKKK